MGATSPTSISAPSDRSGVLIEGGEGVESVIATLTGDTCPVGTPDVATVFLADAAVDPTKTAEGSCRSNRCMP